MNMIRTDVDSVQCPVLVLAHVVHCCKNHVALYIGEFDSFMLEFLCFKLRPIVVYGLQRRSECVMATIHRTPFIAV